MKREYLDYASTTPLDAKVKRAMEPYWSKNFGNPDSVHAEGVAAKKALEEARKKIALVLSSKPSEVYFVSGGTEGNNIAIFGAIETCRKKGLPYEKMHVLYSVIEHSSVKNCFEELRSRGVNVEVIPVREDGVVDLLVLEKLLKPETVLVSVMYSNNEIGTIQPVGKISQLIEAHNSKHASVEHRPPTLFHSDIGQAPLYLEVNRNKIGADMMVFDGHKISGPKGIGVLYVKHGTEIAPVFFGGGQEKNIRSGTVSVPLAVGMAEALSLASKGHFEESKRLTKVRDYFFAELSKSFPKAIINGSTELRIANNANIAYPGLDAEFAVITLDAKGISASAKSACIEGERGSYVIEALGRGNLARSSLRFSFGPSTKKASIDTLLSSLKRILPKN